MEKTTDKPNIIISNKGCDMNAEDKATMQMMTFVNLRNVSFCEVILWCGYGGTYGTSGLNDPKDSCPEVLYKGLSNEALAKQYQVKSASLNPPRGRRYWLLDKLAIPTSPTVRDFNGLKAHYWGQLEPGPDGEPMKLDPKLVQYMPVYFERNSVITFEKDKPVFLLKDNEGITWVYKNYTTIMDPTLTYEDLPNLHKRLKNLPAGFTISTKTLQKDLLIKAVGGKARIMWDELGGSWDALDPGVANYVP